MLTLAASAFAAHTATVTISPNQTNCDSLGNTFTVNVENDAGSTNNIAEVRIYEGTAGLATFSCGPAPAGWAKAVDISQGYGYCEYKETPGGNDDKISPGNSLDFTFDGVMEAIACYSSFQVSTLDDATPTGQHQFSFPRVYIDCTAPIVTKSITDPKILLDPQCQDPGYFQGNNNAACGYWITYNNTISVGASDSTEDDTCNLGLDYCQWRYKLDDGTWNPWNIYEGGSVPDFSFGEDSVHDIEIECYDVVGNLTSITETDRVDDTPPVTTKKISNPKKILGDVEWVDTSTEITLTYVDPEAPTTPEGFDCSIGVKETKYLNIISDDDSPCWDKSVCDSLGAPDVSPDAWQTYDGTPITKDNPSCHILYFYSEDELGNVEDVQTNCFFVDKNPPMVSKDNGDAIPDSGEPEFKNEGNPSGDFHWITQSMPVTFTCDDSRDVTGAIVDDHPSGDEQLCFKVSYDNPNWGYITDQYCPSVGGTMVYDDYCCVSATLKSPFEFYFQEESMHDLEYYCKDAVDKNSSVHTQYYKVDSTAPYLTNKWINGEYYAVNGDCPPDDPTDVCHLDGESTIDIEVADGGTVCAVDGIWCQWGYTLDDGEFYGWYQTFPIHFPEETKHDLTIECYDALGNKMTDQETFYVDHTPPKTTKTYVGPQWPDPITESTPYPHWVDTVTEVELTATDSAGPHDSGVKETMYSVTQVPDMFCEDEYECVTNAQGSGNFVPYTGKFTLPESCQLIEYYSEDNVGKTESTNKQCVYSDHTPPVAYLEGISGPSIDCSVDPTMCTGGEDYWVADHRSTVNLGCMNGPDEPHPAPLDKIYWRIDVDGTGFGPLQEADASQGAQVVFTEDSVHTLEYYCTDKVQKTSNTETIVFRVDSTPPKIIKTVGDPNIPCPLEPTGEGQMECYQIDGVTQITVDAVDPDVTGFGCAVDNVTCEWGYWWLDQYYGPFTEESLPFTISDLDESEHILDIRCWDALGNEVTDTEKFIVDHTPPETTKLYAGPQFSDGAPEYTFFQTTTGGQAVEIKVEDLGNSVKWTVDFPIDDDTCNGLMGVGLIIATNGEGNGPVFQIHNNDGSDPTYNWGTWLYSPWGPSIGDGWFGWHSGNDNTPVTSLDWVEATGGRYREGKPDSPEPNPEGIFTITIDKSELGEQFHWALHTAIGSGFCSHAYQLATYPDGFSWSDPIVASTNYEYAESVKGEYPKWINSSTLISMTATDDVGPHDSGVKETKYRITQVADTYCDVDTEVDNCANAQGDDILGGWQVYTEGTSFNIPQESCHLIEYYSVDNVDKTETVKKQCVYVDNSAPDPVKTVGEPKTKWYPSSDPFSEDYVTTQEYQYLVDACWSTDPAQSIDCWKVTLQTPIDLDCIDPPPHPVDHETVCFHVELDGSNVYPASFADLAGNNVTEEYCNQYNGSYDSETEECCMPKTTGQFYFQEETEHNLQYYCVDALGNTGPMDDEKFKVTGRKFEIQLNKKWNLISLPLSPIDSSIGEVLKDVKDNVNAVWTYDPLNELCSTDWCVYRPTDPLTSNLDTMDQGWGYWLAAYDDDLLVIGGSKFKPGPVGQASRNLVKGWNLVGYYGTDDGQDPPTYTYLYDGPDGDGRLASCALYSLGASIWDKGATTLMTYWEPDNPNQWKEISKYHNMDPGAGYWLGTPGEGYVYYYTDCQGWLS